LRCLLAIPDWSEKDTHPANMGIPGAWPPLGILYIAAKLRQEGFQVAVIDGVHHTKQQIIEAIRSFRPKLIGFSSSALLWPKVPPLAEAAKRLLPDSVIVAGGPGPTGYGADCLKEARSIDAVVVGEGEITMTELAKAVASGADFRKTPGTIARNGDSIQRNPQRPLLADLDSLPPPALDLISVNRYKPVFGHYRKRPAIGLVASRGCPRKCLFCFKIEGNTIRFRAPEAVADEVEFFHRHLGIKEVRFWDEWFTADRQRVVSICEHLIKLQNPVIWSCYATVDSVDLDLLRLMNRAGCFMVNFGFETARQESLDELGKSTTVQQCLEAATLARKAGLLVFGSFILGIPGETLQDAYRTVRLAIKLDVDYADFMSMTLFPGSRAFEKRDEYGRLVADFRTRLGYHLCSFIPHTMTEGELLLARRYAYTRFYARPRYAIKRLVKIRSLADVKILLDGFAIFAKLVLREMSGALRGESPADG